VGSSSTRSAREGMLMGVAAMSVLLPLFYPLSGWFTMLALLQLLLGLASTLGMAGAQTWAMQVSRGDTDHARTLRRCNLHRHVHRPGGGGGRMGSLSARGPPSPASRCAGAAIMAAVAQSTVAPPLPAARPSPVPAGAALAAAQTGAAARLDTRRWHSSSPRFSCAIPRVRS
jgi:hypothetical protein